MTKLSGTLPKGSGNGLESLNRFMVNDPQKTHIVIAIVDCSQVTTEVDSGDAIATARIRRIEPIDPSDADMATRLLRRAMERRTGDVLLPIDMEDELTALLRSLNLDLETGELGDPEPTAPAPDAVEVPGPAPADTATETDLLAQAAELVIETQFCSPSMLQRKLRVGYAKAGRLVEALEKCAVIRTAANGKTRDVLIGAADPEAKAAVLHLIHTGYNWDDDVPWDSDVPILAPTDLPEVFTDAPDSPAPWEVADGTADDDSTK